MAILSSGTFCHHACASTANLPLGCACRRSSSKSSIALVRSVISGPEFLAGSGGFFTLGIASRLIYPTIAGTLRKPGVIFALCLVLLPLCGWDVVPLLIWALVFAGLVLDRSTADAASFARAYRRYLESPIATYFGSRSYSVYLGHLPIIGVCHWVWLNIFPLAGRAATFFGVSAMVVPLTIIASEMLYRGIEKPGIALGSRLARSNMRKKDCLESFVQDVSG